MTKTLLCFFLLSSTTSFCLSAEKKLSFYESRFCKAKSQQLENSDRLVRQVIAQAISQIQEKYNLQPIGMGLGAGLKQVSLELYYYSPLKKNDARKMVLECGDILLNNINACETLGLYLEKYPFKKKQIGVTIYSVNNKYEHYPDPYVCVACLHGDALYFRTDDSENKFRYKSTVEETREEALKRNAEYLAKRGESALDE